MIPTNQLDRAVAEQVMGWRWCDDDEEFARHIERGGLVGMRGPRIFRQGELPDAWVPSRSIADAWLLVERFKMVVGPWNPDNPHDTQWAASSSWGPGLDVWGEVGETAPEAICRLALTLVAKGIRSVP